MRKPGLIISVLLACFLFSRSGDPIRLDDILLRYTQACELFNTADPTNETDSLARLYFDEVIEQAQTQKGIPDTLLFESLWKRGVLSEIAERLSEAKNYYLQALQTADKSALLPDSTRFRPLIYAGGIYYKESKFDSARNMLEQARLLEERFTMPLEADRLYNLLGALYFEGGNYLQSRNCFEKALQLLDGSNSVSLIQRIGFENNIAAALNRLGYHEESLQRYLRLLQNENLTKDLSINIGNVYINLGKYREALQYFNKSWTHTRSRQVLNYIANAYLQLKEYDSAATYLNYFDAEVSKDPSNLSRITQGIHHVYAGDYYTAMQQFQEAANAYQKAITLLLYQYHDTSAYNNPAIFSGVLSSFNLFNALMKKGDCFEKMYTRYNRLQYLQAAAGAFKSATQLAAYLEETMDTDEARIFLKKNSNTAYKKFIDLTMQQYGKTRRDSTLREAYEAVGRNKASILMANIKEYNYNKTNEVPAELLEQERDLKYNIGRLQIKMDQQSGEKIDTMMSDKRNFELKLSGVQSKINRYRSAAPTTNTYLKPDISDEQAILDFYFSDEQLYIFVLLRDSIQSISIPQKQVRIEDLMALQQALQHGSPTEGKTTQSIASSCFIQYVQPFWHTLKNKKEWIIIPDGVFHYLPFDVLINPANSRMLIEDFTISYQVNTAFIEKSNELAANRPGSSVLAIAPFITRTHYAYADSMRLDPLPGTASEVTDLNGRILLDTAATKSSFLGFCNQYNILHLATHAIMHPGKPSQSYIVFYPEDSTRPDTYKLYLNELYNINLDSTRLMVLSACETGVGQIMENEGVMSLSRGVLYAGCPSVITTLWPAADQSTAYIIKQFYRFLGEGYPLNQALRLAKLEFVKQHPQQRHPSYWAHLNLIGATQSLHEPNLPFKLPISITSICVMAVCITVMVKRKKPLNTAGA